MAAPTRRQEVAAALQTVDASIARSAERITNATRLLEKHRSDYASLIQLRALLERLGR